MRSATKMLGSLAASLLFCSVLTAQLQSTEHVVVFKETDRFAGWPANYGIWSWGNEIVTGFFLGYHDDNKTQGHPVLKTKKTVIRQARSVDGGKTWIIEKPSYLDQEDNERKATPLHHAINFEAPGFAMLVRLGSANSGFSTFYYSYDRCKTWNGPFLFPDFGRTAIIGRTDYIVNGKHEMLAFLASVKDNGKEGWPFVAKTTDGGQNWKLLSWIGPQPKDSGFAIMPSTVRLKNNALLSMIRRSDVIMPDNKRHQWIEPYLSADEGNTWYRLADSSFENYGNPPHMIRLKDGRLVLTYGSRIAPFSIMARISKDEGCSWSKEIVLRNDAQTWDLGYTRNAQRVDGKVVTVYYYTVKGAKERHIAATIWDPSNID